MDPLSDALQQQLQALVLAHPETPAFIAREWHDQWPADVLIRGMEFVERDGRLGAYVEYDLRDVEPVAPYHAWVDLERVCGIDPLVWRS
jgi:hypothetical protein